VLGDDITAEAQLRSWGFDPAWFAVGAYGRDAGSRNDVPARAVQRAMKLTGQQCAPQNVIVMDDTVAELDPVLGIACPTHSLHD